MLLKQKLKNFSKLKSLIHFLIILQWGSAFAFEIPKSVLKKYYSQAEVSKTLKVQDQISAEKNNTKLLVLKHNEKITGFARPIETTTGCDSECLPLVYITFYNAKGEYLDLYTKDGLTKKYHLPFTSADYAKLNLVLAISPKELQKVSHPKEMTDAISGATLKKYEPHVVETAAYSTLRIYLYHLETKRHIQKFLSHQKQQ